MRNSQIGLGNLNHELILSPLLQTPLILSHSDSLSLHSSLPSFRSKTLTSYFSSSSHVWRRSIKHVPSISISKEDDPAAISKEDHPSASVKDFDLGKIKSSLKKVEESRSLPKKEVWKEKDHDHHGSYCGLKLEDILILKEEESTTEEDDHDESYFGLKLEDTLKNGLKLEDTLKKEESPAEEEEAGLYEDPADYRRQNRERMENMKYPYHTITTMAIKKALFAPRLTDSEEKMAGMAFEKAGFYAKIHLGLMLECIKEDYDLDPKDQLKIIWRELNSLNAGGPGLYQVQRIEDMANRLGFRKWCKAMLQNLNTMRAMAQWKKNRKQEKNNRNYLEDFFPEFSREKIEEMMSPYKLLTGMVVKKTLYGPPLSEEEEEKAIQSIGQSPKYVKMHLTFMLEEIKNFNRKDKLKILWRECESIKGGGPGVGHVKRLESFAREEEEDFYPESMDRSILVEDGPDGEKRARDFLEYWEWMRKAYALKVRSAQPEQDSGLKEEEEKTD